MTARLLGRRAAFLAYRAVSRARRALQSAEERLSVSVPTEPHPATARERALGLLPPRTAPVTGPSPVPRVTVFGHLYPDAFFGGIATVILVAAALAERTGRPLTVACTLGRTMGTAADVRAFLAENGVTLGEVSVVDVRLDSSARAPLPFHAEDILVASSWYDAVAADQLGRPFVYVVQDFEPNFYARGDRSALAEASYSLAHAVPLFNTSVLRDWFAAEGFGTFVSSGSHFEPAVGLGLRSRGPGGKRLFFYGRSATERNLYALGLMALDLVSADPVATGWTFYAAGDSAAGDLTLAGGQTLRSLGKMTTADYREFAATVDVALSPMLAPHPNYPTLELASLGAAVVTTRFGSKTDLSRYSDRIRLVEPSAEAMARALLAAMAGETRPRAPAMLPGTWAEALAAPLSDLLARLGEAR